MASKIAKAAMAGAHTAGIYADMTVDGPEIGTLVVIVDRAKNLPNRKTMGKQDPYCAARLGKEAKKTETDRRGGQTPRWDQELRFTVHDSPDYNQLKISVFNDDKRTDLIGETWVSLEEILKPGGGQSDKWHGLNCKGRYAGDIQLELTFWDSRPKEERPATESRNASRTSLNHERSIEGLGGPRQLGTVKRRPLPADPVSSEPSPLRPAPEHTHSAPLPHASSRGPRELNPHPAERSHAHAPVVLPSIGYDVALPKSISQPQLAGHGTPQYSNVDEMYLPSANRRSYGNEDGLDNSFSDVAHEQHQQTYQYGGVELPKLPPRTPRTNRRSAQQPSKHHSHPNSNSSPAYTLPQYSTPQERSEFSELRERSRYSNLPLINDAAYQDTPSRPRSFDDHIGQSQVHELTYEPESPPPPPPIHRSSGVGIGSMDDVLQQQQYSPAPLNVIGLRNGASTSPLSFHEESEIGYRQPSPVDTQLSSRSAPMPATYDHYDRPRRHSTFEMEQHSYPPSYTSPGNHHLGEHDIQADHFGRSDLGGGHSGNANPRPYSETPWRDQGGIEGHSERKPMTQRRGNTHPLPQFTPPRQDMYNAPHRPYDQPSDYSRSDEHAWQDQAQYDPRVRHSAAPIIKPRAVSPDPRTPARKSVSPQSPSLPRDSSSGLSGVPFSPDSYNQLNPNLSSATPSINSAGPKYTTPEGAREALREREREERLVADGPIIGSNGKVIDPSDHLPSDTWAPEPERKTPRKTHEIKLKFRNSPHGAQPMPPSAPRPLRGDPSAALRHSLPSNTSNYNNSSSPSVPISHQHHDLQTSPTGAGGRNRLQKRNAGMNSSPMSPPSFNTPPPQQQSSYPLRERPLNYGSSTGSYGSSPAPGYHPPHSSPYASGAGAPPPIPAKVPLGPGRGQEDWYAGEGGGMGMDRLSEELRGIDLGSGSGGRGRSRGWMAGRY